MSHVLIINAHHHYPFAEGKLNATLVALADEQLRNQGHETRIVEVDNGWDVDRELENHRWADIVLLQTPVNWMGVPWTFKRYMDEVYTAGMRGALCDGDGRTAEAPTANYGAGGTLNGKRYMISLTFNAPKAAFDDPDEYLFQGKSVDDLIFPMHMNFRFFAMEALPTFACFDVMKNPQVEADLENFKRHLERQIPASKRAA